MAEAVTVISDASWLITTMSGRGDFRAMQRSMVSQMVAVNQQMDGVAEQSKVAGCPLYLQKHKRASNELCYLRWRHKQNHRHLVDSELLVLSATLPLALRKHCAELHQRAQELNTLSQILLFVEKRCKHLLGNQSLTGW